MAEMLTSTHALTITKEGKTGAYSFWSDTPVSPLAIGDLFSPLDDGQQLKVTKIDISDNVVGTKFGRPLRQWKINIEGDTEPDEPQEATVKYTFSIEQQDNGITVISGSMTVSNSGDAPVFSVNVGEQFIVPGIGYVVCTRINGENESEGKWSTTYDGAKTDVTSVELQKDTEDISHELNGIAQRDVSGKFVVLKRSNIPIMTKSITKYTSSNSFLTAIGDAFAGGIVLSERIVREVVMVGNVEVGAYYRHDIEVEG